MQRLNSSNIFCYPCIYMENNNLGVAVFVPNIGDIRMVGYINVRAYQTKMDKLIE